MARATKILLILMVVGGGQTASADNVELVMFNWIATGNGILEPDDTWKFTYIIDRNYNVSCNYDLEMYLSDDDALDGSDFYLDTYVQYVPYDPYGETRFIPNPAPQVTVQDWPLPPNGWYYVIMKLKPGSGAPADPDPSDNVKPFGFSIQIDSGIYTISGQVENSAGQGIQGVTLSGLPGEPVTDSQGFYTGTVDEGFTAVVTPSADNLSFTPSSISYSDVTEHFDHDYTAQLVQCKISGLVRFLNGKPVAGATVDFDDGAVSSVTTDTNGYYEHYIASGWSGSIQPAKNTYTFSPASTDLTNVLVNTEVDFVAGRVGILYVDLNATGNNNGADWPNAFTRLQDALDEASTNNDIYVASGTYKSDEGGFGTPSDSNATFQLIAGAGLYGGFPNGGADWNQREPSNYPTILSGNISGFGQAFHVVTGADGAILDGFVISDGNAGDLGTNGCGGGMYIDNVNLTVRNCIFRYNYAYEDGGAVYAFADNPGDSISLTLNSCIFENNITRDRGTIYTENFDVEIENCTIADNASNSSPNGGGVYGSNSSVTVLNSILWSNTANGSSSLQAQIYSTPQSPAVEYSCVQNLGGAGGTGNIESDPDFFDADGADYHLNITSPCINSGSPDPDYTDQYDIDGDRRLRYGRADMGADEFVGIDGDLQPDGVVNMADVGILASFWNMTCGAPDWCSDCDINQNTHVDLPDAVVVAEHWLSPLVE